MSTYKVIQDIEAEDKILGPLTLKQFIFAFIGCGFGYLSFVALTKSLAPMLLITLPAMGVFGVLAFPWKLNQPTEVWLGSRLRFLFKPRLRLWDQEGIEEHVTITAPKRETEELTKDLTQTEVKSRLEALASTLDTRGWAVKNVGSNLFTQPSLLSRTDEPSERLIDLSSLPVVAKEGTVDESADMFGEVNTVAQHFDQMMRDSAAAQKQHAMGVVQQAASNQPVAKPAQDYWFMHQNAPSSAPKNYATFQQDQVIHPGQTAPQTPTAPDLQAQAQSLKTSQQLHPSFHAAQGHMKTIQPSQAPATPTTTKPANTTGKPLTPAILELVRNDDFSVATVARQAKRLEQELSDNDTISLH